MKMQTSLREQNSSKSGQVDGEATGEKEKYKGPNIKSYCTLLVTNIIAPE